MTSAGNRARVAVVTLVVGAAIASVPAAAAAPVKGPVVEQMVVYRGGEARVKTLRAAPARVRVTKRKRCAVSAATPLAALVRARPGKIGLRDFGGCSATRGKDGGGLFVRSIRGERNRAQDGWVYKVGRRLGTAGAADSSGPFGNGRLRKGQRLIWFYCHYEEGSCQRTLELQVRDIGAGAVLARVRGYDDLGRGIAVEGATVSDGDVSAITAADGTARLSLGAGSHAVRAAKAGLIRSFDERVTVR